MSDNLPNHVPVQQYCYVRMKKGTSSASDLKTHSARKAGQECVCVYETSYAFTILY